MKSLEIKVVPVVVALIAMISMWGVSYIVPSFDLPFGIRASGGLLLAVLGLALVQAAGVSFRRANTTIDPTRPDAVSSLVTSGIFRYSRNPIYLGMALFLLGWGIFLLNALSLSLVAVFVAYITRFQIIPEERAISAHFGSAYSDYQARVRRWL